MKGLLVALILCTPLATHAGPASINDLASLLAADAIVVADIQGNNVRGVASAILTVAEAVKGDLKPGAVVPILWTGETMQNSGTRELPRQRGLFFLRHEGFKGWNLIPALRAGDIPFEHTYYRIPETECPPEFRPHAGASLEDRLFLLLAWARYVLPLAETGGAPKVVIPVFIGYRSPVKQRVWQLYLEDRRRDISRIGLLGQLYDDDVNALLLIERSPALGGGPECLAIQSHFRSSDPAVASVLGRMATSNSTPAELRASIAFALAAMHTPAMLPYLAALLDSPDPGLRSFGLIGLARFANHVPPDGTHPLPGQWKYRTDEAMYRGVLNGPELASHQSYYLDFWRSWWRQHQAELTVP